MNLEALGAIAESFGAIGVIVSLIYLALQIRQANRDSRADALQQLGRDYSQHSSIVMSDENVSAFTKGLSSFTDLTPEEKVKFDYCVTGYINIMEHAMYHAEAGRVAEVQDMYGLYLSRRLFSYPGMAEWWNHNAGSGFADSTLDWVAAQIDKHKEGDRFWHEND